MRKISKRILFLLVILWGGCTFSAWSQFKAIEPEVWWGASAGGTLSSIGFAPSIKQGMRLGLSVGASFRYIAEEYVGLWMELNFQQTGWKEKFEDLPHEYNRALNYLQLPAMVQVYFGKKNARFFINLGPQIAFLLGESENANFPFDGSVFNNRSNAQYGKKIENKFDYGLTGGLGFELRTKCGCFLLEGRYYLGLSDIYKNELADPFSGSANRVISMKITYFFRFRR